MYIDRLFVESISPAHPLFYNYTRKYTRHSETYFFYKILYFCKRGGENEQACVRKFAVLTETTKKSFRKRCGEQVLQDTHGVLFHNYSTNAMYSLYFYSIQ